MIDQSGSEQHKSGSSIWMKRVRTALLATALGTSMLAVPVLGPQILQHTLPAYAETNNTVQMVPVSFADLVEQVRPAVVSIRVQVGDERLTGVRDNNGGEKRGDRRDERGGKNGDPSGKQPFNDFFRRFFDDEDHDGEPFRPGPGDQFSSAQGSGFVISADGYVVTNHHVIENAARIEVTFSDGTTKVANLVGSDQRTDLAVLKIESGEPFKFVEFASDDIRVGDWVVAVGNPFGLGGTVTAGIVSARGRDIGSGPYDDYIQIDASINKGNSGGPAFNLSGQVVGVNTAIYSPSGGSVGIGFAIPANVVQDVVNELRQDGTVTRGWLGVGIQNITPDIAESLGLDGTDGALVTSVTDNSPADEAGVREGDTVLTVNGDTVKDSKDLARRIARLDPRDIADLGSMRDGEPDNIAVTLGSLPSQRDLAGGNSVVPDSQPDSKTEMVLEDMG
ncbi:MAG: trypsin-like peptidase domain-containing protein, partial [Fimbriimonadaceae bacterium]|nr:trypsin-like peptidase domain-containing protein [Alphaproteobacteria bacterium]